MIYPFLKSKNPKNSLSSSSTCKAREGITGKGATSLCQHPTVMLLSLSCFSCCLVFHSFRCPLFRSSRCFVPPSFLQVLLFQSVCSNGWRRSTEVHGISVHSFTQFVLMVVPPLFCWSSSYDLFLFSSWFLRN